MARVMREPDWKDVPEVDDRMARDIVAGVLWYGVSDIDGMRRQRPLPKNADRYMTRDWERVRDAGVDAEEWVKSDETTPYSFLWCCDVLGVDPALLRARVDADDFSNLPTGKLHLEPAKPKVMQTDA